VKGFSLLEVLVTMLLTTIGILGMVAMQGHAISNTQDSIQRTHAVMLANDFMEIVRARPSVLVGLQEDPDSADTPFFDQLTSDLPSADCLELSTDDLTTDQVACWAQKVKRYLPGAENAAESFHACISTTPGNCSADGEGAVVEVQMAWEGIGEECLRTGVDVGDDDSVCTYRFRTQI
jgi:type IV pilus assembly protein PilV